MTDIIVNYLQFSVYRMTRVFMTRHEHALLNYKKSEVQFIISHITHSMNFMKAYSSSSTRAFSRNAKASVGRKIMDCWEPSGFGFRASADRESAYSGFQFLQALLLVLLNSSERLALCQLS